VGMSQDSTAHHALWKGKKGGRGGDENGK